MDTTTSSGLPIEISYEQRVRALEQNSTTQEARRGMVSLAVLLSCVVLIPIVAYVSVGLFNIFVSSAVTPTAEQARNAISGVSELRTSVDAIRDRIPALEIKAAITARDADDTRQQLATMLSKIADMQADLSSLAASTAARLTEFEAQLRAAEDASNSAVARIDHTQGQLWAKVYNEPFTAVPQITRAPPLQLQPMLPPRR
jgi:peptidoglycan hydrolase CwlO-like protein